MKSKHIVEYIGNGVWTDSKGVEFINGKTNEYETELTQEQFMEERKDFAFMEEYGQMKVNTISIDDEKKSTVPQTPVDPAKSGTITVGTQK